MAKGAAYEREVCQRLSRWATGMKREDIFWRSAMSGGRFTQGQKSGKSHTTQMGDISAVDPLGAPLISRFMIECKWYKELGFEQFFFDKGTGELHKFWHENKLKARLARKRLMLFAKQNWLGQALLVSVDTAYKFILPASRSDLKPLIISPSRDVVMFLVEDFLAHCSFEKLVEKL